MANFRLRPTYISIFRDVTVLDTHIADGTIHFTVASIDHTAILNIGTNSHAAIDTHIADLDIHFSDAPADSQDYVRNNNAWIVPAPGLADGTVTNNTLRWSGSAWVETGNITIDPTGAVNLDFNALLVLATRGNGIDVHATSGFSNGHVHIFDLSGQEGVARKNDSGQFDFYNVENGENVRLLANDAGGAQTTLLEGDPDGSVDLYYDDTLVAQTNSQGMKLFAVGSTNAVLQVEGSGGGDAGINFIEAGVATQLQIKWDQGLQQAAFRITGTGDDMRFWGDGSGTMMLLTDGGSADLYFNGTLTAATIDSGINLHSGTNPQLRFTRSSVLKGLVFSNNVGDVFTVRNEAASGHMLLAGRNAADSAYNILVLGDPDDSLSLYHIGLKILETHSKGITLTPGSASDIVVLNITPAAALGSAINFNEGASTKAQIFWIPGDNNFKFKVTDTGKDILFSNDADGVLCRMNGGGAVDLYYNGILEASTKSGGFLIDDELEINGALNHDGAAVGLYGTAPAAQSAAYTRNATIVEDRTLLASASATTLNNNNVLAALIADLQSRGFIG